MNKKMVISGATSGLGKAAVNKLAEQGNDLILIGRSKEKGQALIDSLYKRFPEQSFHYYSADCSSIDATKQTVEAIKKEHDKIDVILNNVGGVFSKFELTKEGYERTIATNHLSYFVFTLGLLPLLNKQNGRIVNVASKSHLKGTLDIDSFTKKKDYFIMKAYGQSKLANIMFTYSLKEKLKDTGITVNALNPGKVKTDIGGKAKHWLHQLAWGFSVGTSGITLDEGVRTHVFLASHPDAANINGKYFDNMKLLLTSEESYDKKKQADLWKWSEQATNMTL